MWSHFNIFFNSQWWKTLITTQVKAYGCEKLPLWIWLERILCWIWLRWLSPVFFGKKITASHSPSVILRGGIVCWKTQLLSINLRKPTGLQSFGGGGNVVTEETGKRSLCGKGWLVFLMGVVAIIKWVQHLSWFRAAVSGVMSASSCRRRKWRPW